MINRPVCPKGQRKNGSPCIFCQDGSYCAHQYYCSDTRRYENTGYQGCRKFKPPSARGGGIREADDGGFSPAEMQRSLQRKTLSQATADSPLCEGGLTEEKTKEVKSSGAKKTNRRKPRKG